MNNILEMIKNEKVEWKKLGDVCEIGTGKSNTNQQVENGKYPFYVRSKDIKRIDEYEFDEEAIIIPGEGGIGEIYHYINGKYALHQRAYRIHVLKDYIKSKYVYYYMQAYFYNFILKSAVGSTVSSIRKGMIENFEIPIPSLETQERIVKILDTMVDHFTQLEAELEAELEARNKQYEYYRDKLLSEEYLNKLSEKFGGKVEHEELGDVLSYEQPTKYIVKSTQYNDEYTIPVLTAGKSFILGYTNEEDGIYYASKKDPVIIFDDFTSGYHWVEFNFKIKSSAMKMIKPKKDVNFKYCYYYMGKYYTDITDHKRLWISIYSKNIIPIPPIPVQEHIVSVLDNFNKIVTDINEGLPKEIELRQKQYEYYRERLLDFKRDDDE